MHKFLTVRFSKLGVHAALIFALGLAVFCWGLHYKLSLYSHPVPSAVRQPAKLLSQQERPILDAQQIGQAEPVIVAILFIAFAALLLGMFPPSLIPRLVRTSAILPSHESGLSEVLLRRPPPTTFLPV